MSPRRLAHFEITDLLGKGGMGEVYRATDTKLQREVALKLLPPEFSSDPERSARLAREARTLASLHHPNIAAIHGFEEADGQRFLIMELAEGEDLSQRLARGPIEADEAIELAQQIAAGLEAAHDQNVVHRDLKPANIKLTPQGGVKILDFGLARAFLPADASGALEDPALSPTITARMTAAGTILGTAAYMAPEQARGKAIDKRADIWAFGAILWEMLTGQRLFAGETVSDTLADVLRAPIGYERLPANTPPHVRHLLERCLQRDPKLRLRDIGEARLMLADPSLTSAHLRALELPDDARSKPRARTIGILTLLTLLAFAAGWFAQQQRMRGASGNGAVSSMLQARILAPKGFIWYLNSSGPAPVALSPDGRFAVFGATDGQPRLWVQDLSRAEAQALDGTERAQYPFWSPDSRKIGFFARGQMHWIAREGGPAVAITAASDGKGATWNRDNTIVFTPDANEPLYKVSAEGGAAEPITDLNVPEDVYSHRHPRFLPDGRHFLFVARGAGSAMSAVMVGSLDGEAPVVLFRNPTQADYAQGHLLYERDGTLLARPFDPVARAFRGDPTPIARDVRTLMGAVVACFSVSQTGRLVVQEGEMTSTTRLVALMADGQRNFLPGEAVSGRDDFDVSPDETVVIESVLDPTNGNNDLWRLDIARGIRQRLTSTPLTEANIHFLPNGREVVFASSSDARESNVYSVFRQSLEPGATKQEVFHLDIDLVPANVSPDGQWVLCEAQSQKSGRDLWLVSLADSSLSRPLLQSPYDEQEPNFSPDGRWMSFASNESGGWDLYVQDFPAGKRRQRVSSDGGYFSRWATDGYGIFYGVPGNRLMFLPVRESGDGLDIGSARVIAEMNDGSSSAGEFEVYQDGIVYAAREGEVFDDRMLVVDGWEKLVGNP